MRTPCPMPSLEIPNEVLSIWGWLDAKGTWQGRAMIIWSQKSDTDIREAQNGLGKPTQFQPCTVDCLPHTRLHGAHPTQPPMPPGMGICKLNFIGEMLQPLPREQQNDHLPLLPQLWQSGKAEDTVNSLYQGVSTPYLVWKHRNMDDNMDHAT